MKSVGNCNDGGCRSFARYLVVALAICAIGILGAVSADRVKDAPNGTVRSPYDVTAADSSAPVELRALYQAQNGPSHLLAYFNDTSVRVMPLAAEQASWGALDITFGGYTYRGQMAGIMGADLVVEGNRLKYVFSTEPLEASFANTERGLEQTFTLSGPPIGTPKNAQQPIQLSFGLSGDLLGRVLISDEKKDVYFQSQSGDASLRYSILSVTGKSGSILPVHLTAQTTPEGTTNGVRIVFESPTHEEYPIFVQMLLVEGQPKDSQPVTKVVAPTLYLGNPPPVSGGPEVAPANDQCAGAEVIPAAGPFPYTTALTADITDATTTGDPTTLPSCQTSISRSIWYRFTPTTTALYTISSCADAPTGSTVDDNVLAIYTSSTSACGGTYTQLAGALGCDDDTCTNETAQAVISGTTLTAGTTYFILVHKFGTTAPTAGNTAIQLRISQVIAPANDTCAGAIALTLNTPFSGTNAGAAHDYLLGGTLATCYTSDAEVGQTTNSGPGRDTVYSFTAPSAGLYSFRAISQAAGGNLVLYTNTTCPSAPPVATITCAATVRAANRTTSSGALTEAEEIMCKSMAAGETRFLFVDELALQTAGGSYVVEVNPCTRETEANGTPATANALACPIEGSIAPAGTDVDFFTLGTPATGSRVFSVADGVAGGSGSGIDFDMRVTNATDTLEFDDFNNSAPWGNFSPNIAGRALTGVASYIRLNHDTNSVGEPYRLYTIIQPAGGGLGGSSAASETEPNGTSLAVANTSASNFFSGTITPGGVAGDLDLFAFGANAGDLIMLNIDGDPLRNLTPVDYAVFLYDQSGNPLLAFTDTDDQTSSNTSGAGSLTATTPKSAAEAATWRARYSGVYYAGVNTQSAAATGDYLYSIGINCLRGDQLSADLSVTKVGPATAPANSNLTYTITVKNNGPNAATGVTFTDTLPPGTSFVSLSGPAGWTCTPASPTTSFTCTNQGLGANLPQAFTLVVKVPQCFGNTDAVNSVTVSSLTPDPSTANNTASAATVISDPRTCDDGSACTTGDTCVGTVCQGGPPPPCDDGNACTANTCNVLTGLCENPPIVCNDNNSCTNDTCDPASGCVFTPNDGNTCSDGNACTSPDHCSAGSCVSTTIVCNDNNACTDDTCAPASGCVFTNDNTNTCTDGNACTVDSCVNGVCTSAPRFVTGTSTGTVTINDGTTGGPSAAATPYPSTITIPGGDGSVVSLQLTINGLTHTFPDDLDIQVVGPTGAKAVVMSDAGGGTDLAGINLTFSDAAGTAISDPGPLASGTFKPADYEAGDVYPAPAPAPGGTLLSVFNGTNPAGTWSLFVADDAGGDTGSITSWSLKITVDCDDHNACTTDSCDPVSGCVHTPINCDDGHICTVDGCNPATGVCTHTPVNCDDGNACTTDSCIQALVAPACIVPDNGSGTVTLPPAGCDYLSPDDVHEIINGLPPGTTVELTGIHHDFVCNRGSNGTPPGVCDFVPSPDCDQPGGALGGREECSDSTLQLTLHGTGVLAGWDRTIQLPVAFETHVGPRTPGAPFQSFPTDMFKLQGQLPPGDPDFDLLRITAGSGFNLPSPGHTTLTQLPGGNFSVDSFFDITYTIEFVGHQGGHIGGMSGSTTATIRMQTGSGVGCVHSPVICDDGNPCTDDSCDPASGCVTTPHSCDDGNPCTDDSCTPAAGCVHTTHDCNDGNACTTDSCDPVSGCHYAPVSCDDGNRCTDDSCVAAAGCVHTPHNCDDSNACTTDTCDNTAPLIPPQCVVPDNGNGTVTLPPAGCDYLSPQQFHEVVDGLPPGTTIQLGAIHREFICRGGSVPVQGCSFVPPPGTCEQNGGALGGTQECSDSSLALSLHGTGTLTGWDRSLTIPVRFETHVGPRTPNAPIQSFDTDMFRLQGQVTGDPDFDLLRITAGTSFGMPSPGHTTLTQRPGSTWSVDSFFDITYRIDFVGHPGGHVGGMSGSTTGTIRMATGTSGCVNTPIICDDGNPCTDDSCDPASGCVHTPHSCDDGNACTTDACVPASGCVNTPVSCDDGQICTEDACDPATGQCTHTALNCDDGNACTADSCIQAFVAPACIVPDNGSGTVTLPPAGCDYLSPQDVHEISNGLPPGTTIELTGIHRDFVCHQPGGPANCSFVASPSCDQPGGTLGGRQECADSSLALTLHGTGTLTGWDRALNIPVTFETHVGPRTPGAPFQSFPTAMFRLQGQITGDPDFDLLRITAGNDFGLPSPGHTTLRQQPGGDWAVDSFFDITYRIDFVGHAGGHVGGMSGSTTATIRMQTGNGVGCIHTPISCDDGNPCTDDSCDPVSGCVHTPHNCDDGNRCTDDACTPAAGCVHTPHNCDDSNPCTTDTCDPTAPLVQPPSCVVADNGFGTVTLPPAGCDYLSPSDVHEIIDGLPPGTTVELTGIHREFVCNRGSNGTPPGVCDFVPSPDCDRAGGALGGREECSDSQLAITLHGTGSLSGWDRTIQLPVSFETHVGPRTPGAPVQSFDTDMFKLQGQLPPGDPDFDLLRITAGTGFGMPSPGHTTLTQRPGSTWSVDSFFDITYRIDFVGHPGGHLGGMSGSTTATIRMATGSSGCVHTPVSCDDGNACTLDSCDPVSGTCVHTPVVCNDNNKCTTDSCDATTGQCVYTPVSCDDGQICTEDACDPSTGQCTHTAVNCDDGNACTADSCIQALVAPACIVSDNGFGTVTLPPAGCDYLSPQDVHEIQAGLPPGTTIELTGIHRDFACRQPGGPANCSFVASPSCDQPGGTLGGRQECSDSSLALTLHGTGTLSGWDRTLNIPVTFETHVGPRTPGAPFQSFPTAMFRLQGQLPPGDPDFDLLRITAGNDFGLPSPGHTTLRQQPGGTWAVDSFFDITYRIDFVGHNGGHVGGMSGSTTATIRMQTGSGVGCTHTPISCDDGNACTDDSCDPATGCVHTPHHCDDGNRCTDDSCNPMTGCVYTPHNCDDSNPCTTDTCDPTAPLVQPPSCVVADNGFGTVTLPPAGCDYLSPSDVHEIIDGLPPGTTVELTGIHREFVCNRGSNGTPPGVCDFVPSPSCDVPGGGLGGREECADSQLALTLHGTGTLAGWDRTIPLPVSFETHVGPRTPGAPIQSFDTDMFKLQGQLPPGDPDFDLLRITAGTGFGLPSPGHTTLTQRAGGMWSVDSFFDITYRIDFVGHPGGHLGGMSGSTTATIRMATGSSGCVHTPVSCDDGNACTLDSCDPVSGQCVHTAVVCNDSNACTTDSCDPTNGQCVYTPVNCDDGQICTEDACDPSTGQCTHTAVNCDDHNACTEDSCIQALVTPACVVPDNGSGTATLPPAGCDYLSPQDVHEIFAGLPAGTTIQLGASHRDFICNPGGAGVPPGVCDFTPAPNSCDVPGGALGGRTECADSSLALTLHGTGVLTGWDRTLQLPMSFQTHVGPRTPGAPVQSFPTDMYKLQGEITGDPDFDLLRITAGTGFGLPSPGHTTLTQLPGGNWSVDSFFDITYRIDFVGHPGGHVGGMSGSTTGTIRMQTGSGVGCVHTPISCDDGNACTDDSCDPATGCVHTPHVCNDGNACTDDSCNPASGCVYTPDDTNTCNDGSLCTTGDHCSGGTCVGTPVACSDGNACTTDACDPETGCSHTVIDCNDHNKCTNDSCNRQTGCVFAPVNCNDNNACSTDTCEPNGGCVHTTINCNDNNVCTNDSCNPTTGCVYTPISTHPAPINNSLRLGKGPAGTALTWSDPPGPYNVYRGSNGPQPWEYDQTCFAHFVPSGSAQDPAIPAPFTFFYYVVSRAEQCGESSLGTASSGAEIPNSSPCAP